MFIPIMADLKHWTYLWPLCFTLLCLWRGSAAQISYSILEESEKGTVVGNITKDLKLNLQQLHTTGLHITSAQDKQYLDINRKSGIIFVNERIDREELCLDVVKCVLNMEAIVDNPHGLHRIDVVIIDINDNVPKFMEDFFTIDISEYSYVGEKHPLPVAHDADEGSNSVKTYKLSPNEYFSLDVQDAGDHSVTAELVLQKTLDREKQSVIDLTLSAIDGAKPAKTGTVQLKVNVLDVNDNSPLFSKSLYKAQVVENIVMGTALLTLTATDLDEGVNGQLVYSFADRGRVKSNEKFIINSNTGEITVKGNIDYEEKQAYEIRVQVRDKGVPPRLAHGKVLVEVMDVNDNAPEISVTSILSPVKEDVVIGTAVAMISITDRDGGKNGLTNCKIVGSAPFKLNRNYKNYYSLLVDGPLDRETVSEYNISITAADEGTLSLSSASVIHVKVADVNDNAPHFQEPVINIYVKENSQIGSIIYTLTSSDLDSTENARISYGLLNSDKNNVPMSSAVNVNSDTGEIVTLQTFNFEEQKTFQFKVQATDSGVPPLSSNVTVNVFILDENDNSPTILAPYSEHGSVNSESIPYSAEAGYFVAKIRAVDADSGYNALLSYHLSEPKGNNLFRIGTSTGEIRTKRRMSDNDLKTHPLVVLVCDNGEPSLSASVTIDVVVVESTADIQTQFRHVPIKEDSFSDLNLYLLIAIVAVSVIFLLSLITLIAVRCHRTESSLSRYSAPMITTHPDGSWSYSKSTQQYDVCFSSDTLKSDVVVFPAPFPPVDAELISINGGDTFTRTQTLPNTDKLSYSVSEEANKGTVVGNIVKDLNLNVQDIETRDLRIISTYSEITVRGSLDYEETPAYEIRIQAMDQGPVPRSSHAKLLIEVIDVNDNAPEITITSLMSPVKEDAELGTIVALIGVSDRDGGNNGVTHCKVLGSVPFKLTSNYKNDYSLVVDGPLDREDTPEYNVSITASDEGSPPLSSIRVITVHVSDVNDNAPRFTAPVINIYVKENSATGSMLCSANALDADLDNNAKVSYTIVNSYNRNIPTAAAVNINSETGEIVSLQTFNFEKLKTFQFKVQATDSGVPPLSSNVTVNVFILDENDNSPTILAPYSEHGSVNSESIPYSAEAGYFVAKIRAVDADSGYNALLSYHLSEPKGNNLFRIGTSTGEIRTKRRMSDNDLKTHPLVVLVCDNGEPSLSASVTIDVVVVESTADIQTQFRHVPIKEDSFSDLNLYLLVAIVAVSVIFLLSLITLIAVRCHRTESSLSRYSAPMITTHPDGSWSYSKSTQQYDVCFSSDTLKSDVVVFPAPFPPVDAELISINGGDTFSRTQTLPNTDKKH
ncbi:protocadherin alpha-5-like [Eucyclogobius newberryi]|uniref:protocadherin alpha-5-like n=1 Tax=Eucyclogobius newberryi TaxID=166745 RepID=UPI003B5D03F5